MKWHGNSKARFFATLVCGGICCFGCTQTSLRAPSFATRGKPQVDESQLAMARLNERQGQGTAARDTYEKLLTVDPDQQTAHHRLAVIAAGERRFQEADAHFRQAFALGPADAELLADAGYLFYLQDRLDEAERALKSSLDRDSSNVRARNNLGLVYGQQGRFEEAFAMFREASATESNDAGAYANMAYVYSQHNMLDKAQSHYSRALTLDTNLRPAAEAMVQLAQIQPAGSNPPLIAGRSRQRTLQSIEEVTSRSTSSPRTETRPAEHSIATTEQMNRTLATTAPSKAEVELDSPATASPTAEEVTITDANRTWLESASAAEMLLHTASAAEQLIQKTASRVGPSPTAVAQGPIAPVLGSIEQGAESESTSESSPAARAALTPSQVVAGQPEVMLTPQTNVEARRSPVVRVSPEFPTPTVVATANRAAVNDRNGSAGASPEKSKPRTVATATVVTPRTVTERYTASTPPSARETARVSTTGSSSHPAPAAPQSLLQSAIAKGPPLPQAAPTRAAASPPAHGVPADSSRSTNKASSSLPTTAATRSDVRAPSSPSSAPRQPVVASTTRQASSASADSTQRASKTQAATSTSKQSSVATKIPRELPSSRGNAAASKLEKEGGESSTLTFGRTVSASAAASDKPAATSSTSQWIAPTSSGAQNSPSVIARTSASIAFDDEAGEGDYGFAIASDDED